MEYVIAKKKCFAVQLNSPKKMKILQACFPRSLKEGNTLYIILDEDQGMITIYKVLEKIVKF